MQEYNTSYYKERHEPFLKKDLEKISAFKALRDFTAPQAQEKILEAGCGIGYVLHYVCKDTGAEGYGIDFVDHAIRRASRLFPEYHFFCQDATATDFENNTFDKIFCFHVIEHVPDYKQLLAELKRILKPGGILVLGTEMLEALNTKIFNLFIGDPTHVKEFYTQELIELMEEYFTILDSTTASCVGRFPHVINRFFHLFLKGEIIIKAMKENHENSAA